MLILGKGRHPFHQQIMYLLKKIRDVLRKVPRNTEVFLQRL